MKLVSQVCAEGGYRGVQEKEEKEMEEEKMEKEENKM